MMTNNIVSQFEKTEVQKSELGNVTLQNETPADFDAVEEMSAVAFGPGRFSRTAFRLREGVAHEAELSFVAFDENGKRVGSVRLTKMLIGSRTAILLGPLVVTGPYKNKGLGGLLMRRSIEAAKAAGHELVLLVGDLPYYQRFGFQTVPNGQIMMPAPVAKHRILVCELVEGVLEKFEGEAARYSA